MLLSIDDNTQREAAAREVREAAARMQAVVERATDAIITFDAEGRIESINHAGELMFGYAGHEVTGQPPARLWTDAFRGQFDSQPAELSQFG